MDVDAGLSPGASDAPPAEAVARAISRIRAEFGNCGALTPMEFEPFLPMQRFFVSTTSQKNPKGIPDHPEAAPPEFVVYELTCSCEACHGGARTGQFLIPAPSCTEWRRVTARSPMAVYRMLFREFLETPEAAMYRPGKHMPRDARAPRESTGTARDRTLQRREARKHKGSRV